MDVAGPITTSSVGPGRAPVLQFAVVFQSPLPPVHETVAAVKVSVNDNVFFSIVKKISFLKPRHFSRCRGYSPKSSILA